MGGQNDEQEMFSAMASQPRHALNMWFKTSFSIVVDAVVIMIWQAESTNKRTNTNSKEGWTALLLSITFSCLGYS